MSMRPMLACATAILVLFSALAAAMDTEQAFDDPTQQERYVQLTKEFRCPKCRSESIADSSIEVSRDLRRQVKELIQAGKTDDEIRQYMTDRYGEYLLYKPAVNSKTWVLWAAPVLLLVGGCGIAFVVISRKSKLPDTDPADPGLGAS